MLGMGLSNFIAGQEWIFIIIIAVVFIFGAKKIPELAKTFGKAKGEFEKGKIEGEKELKDLKDKETKSD
ncbi:twin-arginine translocase TatA/TatE family subunit [Nitrosopumilus sp.]|uniref:Sec-independent protein translocase subunit TatA/TatB n=1 Tax=Nitrosopumilus sp. TaxID=2024843 RepID=UPI00247F034D|nr:twin-arginine translocase TatA/TatE family subunit [Nitrosopumilus sp.]MCV0410015.1 twin-arginine translocase TatA/TatE family subunit [Nitrosopumilus sp.]